MAGAGQIKVDPSVVADAASQITKAASPVTQTIDAVSSVTAVSSGFATTATVNAFSRGWADSLEKLTKLLTGIGTSVAGAGTVYQEQETKLSRMAN